MLGTNICFPTHSEAEASIGIASNGTDAEVESGTADTLVEDAPSFSKFSLTKDTSMIHVPSNDSFWKAAEVEIPSCIEKLSKEITSGSPEINKMGHLSLPIPIRTKYSTSTTTD